MCTIDFSSAVTSFFDRFLRVECKMARNTILSYRDVVTLLVRFIADSKRKTCDEITLEDVTAETVKDFLDHLEAGRGNSKRTRSQRHAVLRTFVKYICRLDPCFLAQAKAILDIYLRRYQGPPKGYIEQAGIKAIISGITGNHELALRDDALLRILYNTGVRASEVADANIDDVRFDPPFCLSVIGKGEKEKRCPLWPETVRAIRVYLKTRSVTTIEDTPLFVNAWGVRLTRFGIRYIVMRRANGHIQGSHLSRGKHVTTHTFRHSTAVHLVESGNDLTSVRDIMGHKNISTTNEYVETNMKAKAKILENNRNVIPKPTKRGGGWKGRRDIVSWLKNL